MATLNWSLSLSGTLTEDDDKAMQEKVAKFVKSLGASVQGAQYSTNRQEYMDLMAPEAT